MILVRLISLLIAAFFVYAAYRSPDAVIPMLMASAFFAFMAYLSFRNSGAVDSPYIFFAIAAVTFFYSLTGVVSGEYSWKRYSFSVQHEPEMFWSIFSVSLLIACGLLVYGYAESKKKTSPTQHSRGTR
jgi:hypothetical protein